MSNKIWVALFAFPRELSADAAVDFFTTQKEAKAYVKRLGYKYYKARDEWYQYWNDDIRDDVIGICRIFEKEIPQ